MFNNGSVNWISLNSHKSLLGKENGRIWKIVNKILANYFKIYQIYFTCRQKSAKL